MNQIKKDSSVFIADGAKVMGKVTLGKNVSIWYNAVVRSDLPNTEIVIGDNSNVQDGSVIHNDHEKSTIIGKNVTIGHNCVIHGCIIEDNCLVGMGAVVLSGAVIKKGTIVAAGSVVKENFVSEENVLIAGVPAKEIKKLTESHTEGVLQNAMEYIELASKHKCEL